uniref:Pre-rRNA-processing protein IPI3 n=1 Tax=Anthurium amnicola TaxID=1678845 RepID=A0A1D1YZ22_9ARAE
MVQVADPGRLRPESEVPGRSKGGAAPAGVAVKLEVEDPLEEEHGPENKRSKLSLPFQQKTDGCAESSQQQQYNPLCEPSPLGLRLRKSPSLLDLIQMRLSQGNSSKACHLNGDGPEVGKKKDTKSGSATAEKMKASNFPATLLRIGNWECVSRYEGDLVAKCYFAKRKLVWEVLDGGLKSKIEIQWSDITAVKATCPDDSPSTLDIMLARQPLFFKETNPQPRKHTLWQATSDFTGGQASLNRHHFLQVPQGLLSKHFEKLIQCDPRLHALSRQPDIILDSPYFESRCSVFEDQEETKCLGLDHIKGEYGSPFSGLHDAGSPSTGVSSSRSETRDLIMTPDLLSQENPSPSSVMDSQLIEENASCEMGEFKELNKWDHWDQFKLPGIHPSMSMSDLVHHISEQMTSGNPLFSGDAAANKDTLEEITQYLLSDSQTFAASDENSLMSRVNSLCCLIQKDPTSQNLQMNGDNLRDDDTEDGPNSTPDSTSEKKPLFDLQTVDGECNDASCKQQPPMSRKESVGDLLLYLPRIASLPQFLFNISEDAENKAR